jgi:lysophospholipid acyltransferase (LPLAT)-like uncharacterized protein
VLAPDAGGAPRIYAFWHAQMLPMLVMYRGSGLSILISEHRDGERIARVAERFGYRTIRGSTRRGAASALRGIERALGAGQIVVVTPDGPRGPAEEFAPGALIAAHRAGVPLVLGAATAQRAWRLSTWDRFLIPKPFARVTVAIGGAIDVGGASAREAAAEAPRIQEALRALNSRARDG